MEEGKQAVAVATATRKGRHVALGINITDCEMPASGVTVVEKWWLSFRVLLTRPQMSKLLSSRRRRGAACQPGGASNLLDERRADRPTCEIHAAR